MNSLRLCAGRLRAPFDDPSPSDDDEMEAGTFVGPWSVAGLSTLCTTGGKDLGIRCMTRVFRGADREAHCPAHDGEGDCSGVGGARPRVA